MISRGRRESGFDRSTWAFCVHSPCLPKGGRFSAPYHLSPQLHTHVLVANMSRGPDGRWTALDSRSIYAHARTAGFVYQAVLRHELARSVGFLFEEVSQGYADIAGVPRDLRKHFSERRREITTEMERHGATSARGAQVATLATRHAKTARLSEAELREQWAESARPFEFSPETLPRLVRSPAVDVDDADLAGSLIEHDATFGRRDAVRAVAAAATQGAELDAIEDGPTSSWRAVRRFRSRRIASRRPRCSPSSTAPWSSPRLGKRVTAASLCNRRLSARSRSALRSVRTSAWRWRRSRGGERP